MAEIRKCIMSPGRTAKDGNAALFLELFWLCQTTQTLPKSGGILDQDSLYVYLSKNALVWQNDRQELDRHKASVHAPTGRRA